MAAGSAWAGDFRRFPDYRAETAASAELEELRALLEEARQLREENARPERARAGETLDETPAAPSAKSARRARRIGSGRPGPAPAEAGIDPQRAGREGTDDAPLAAPASDAAAERGDADRIEEDPAPRAGREAGNAEAPAAARPGCMYRDRKLIWEKAPGTCAP